jgi:multidrug resistance efflux pump
VQRDRITRGQIGRCSTSRSGRIAHAHASLAAARNGAASAEAARQSAEAALELARASYRRIEQLREKNSATPQELDRATADLQMAEAGVRAATARHAEAAAAVTAAEAAPGPPTSDLSTITAPFTVS